MKVLPMNNYQNNSNQTNFKARVLKIGTNIMLGDYLAYAFDDLATLQMGKVPSLKIVGVIGQTAKVLAELLFKTKESLNKFAEILAPKMHEAKYTDGEMIDLTEAYNALRNAN